MSHEERLISQLADESPDALRLARVVSLAVLIEPQLLRRARLELLKGVDAGAEADLWLSHLVRTRGPRGITLLPRAAELLRADLARRPGRFQKAWLLTEEMHRGSPQTVILEEKINRLSAKPDGRALREIEALFESVAETLRREEGRSGLLNWVASALPRLPAQVRKLGAAQMLATASYFHLTSNLPLDEKSKGGDLPDWLSWAIPKHLPPFDLGVQLVEGGVLVGGPAPPENTIPVPGTNPLIVELSWPLGQGRHVEQVRLARGERRKVAAPPVEIQLRTAHGARYVIAPQHEGAAAEPEPAERADRKTCFVVMGFGEKVDFETGRKLNLDASYQNIIEPAVQAAGLECVRADAITHSGVIEVPLYDRLLKADVVVADLSTSNSGAFYQLGVRYGLRPYTTILICEDGATSFPFDINHIIIRKYKHLGSDIGVREAKRFQKELTGAITEAVSRNPPATDSPVYTFLEDLVPPSLPGWTPLAPRPDADAADDSPTLDSPTISVMMQQADMAIGRGDFVTAKSLLIPVRTMMKQGAAGRPEDPYLIRRLALATSESRIPSALEALREARALLRTLDPETSNDAETLGLWGEVHKRLWEETREGAHLDEAIRAHERGFYLRNDYRNGINFAFLLNLRAARADAPAEAVADFVRAARVRRELLSIVESESGGEQSPSGEQRFWRLAAAAEAYLGAGEEMRSEEMLKRAFDAAPARWMRDTASKHMAELRALLADSPLRHVRSDVD
jgi:hypothetical protein